ncbi:MAG: T9SS type A sorting domain-containing protein [Bacteroidales bacterium]|nr:T9SS type A sorting domain-containing protein [Bacteroidales bacterium]
MKTNILSFVFFAIVLSSLPAIDLNAQTVVDTNYYRYAHTPLVHEFWMPVWSYDESVGHIIDSVSMCTKDKVGFGPVGSEYLHNYIGCIDVVPGHPNYPGWNEYFGDYHQNPLPHGDIDIYGVAVFIDSVKEFHPGDYVRIYICEKADDGTHFERLDSITLDETTVGVRRYMTHPITTGEIAYPETVYDSVNNAYYPIPLEDCTLFDEQVQVLEIYFDQPVHIRDTFLYWKIEMLSCRSKVYYSFRTQINGPSDVRVFGADCTPHDRGESWDHMMAIIEPLPQWEEDRMELLITDVVEDPDDPENPDPDNPGGDEGIGEAVGSQQSAVRIYPNPASNSTVVTCDAEIQELTICDINGRLIRTLRNCGTSTTLDTSTLTPGLYTLQVTTTTATTTRKLAVK